MKKNLLIRSFGYGIMSAEVVPAPEKPARPNGDRSAPEGDALKMVRESGLRALEAALDPEDPNRVYLLMAEGHAPSRYELGQMEEEDWKRLKAAVTLAGSSRFSERLSMLVEDGGHPADQHA